MTTLTKRTSNILRVAPQGSRARAGHRGLCCRVSRCNGDEILRQFELADCGEGTIKFLRGGYGCGKTFVSRLAILDAQARGFATSFVVVSDNDLRFHRFDDVYRKVMTELGTASCPRGALGDMLDRWIGRVEQIRLSPAGRMRGAEDFDEQVRKRLDEDLTSLTAGHAPRTSSGSSRPSSSLSSEARYRRRAPSYPGSAGASNVAASAKIGRGHQGRHQEPRCPRLSSRASSRS